MRIKGTSISSFLGFLEVEYGATRTRDFITTLPTDLRKRCEGLVLASAFYAVEELETMARKARQHFGGDGTFYERSGAHYASVGLNGVHQAMLARPTPLDFLWSFERSWTQFVDEGGINVTVVGDGRVRVRFDHFRGSDVRCPRVTGFLGRALHVAGGKGISVAKNSCTERGDRACEWTTAWDFVLSPPPLSQTSAIKRPVLI